MPPDPFVADAVRERVERYATTAGPEGAAVVCTASLRPLLADFLHRSGIRVDVFGYSEIPPEIALRPLGLISVPERAAGGTREPVFPGR